MLQMLNIEFEQSENNGSSPTVFLPFFTRKTKSSEQAGMTDHRWKVEVTRDDISCVGTHGPYFYELDDRMTIFEFLKFLNKELLNSYSGWNWEILTSEGTLGIINDLHSKYECFVQDTSIKERNIIRVHCRIWQPSGSGSHHNEIDRPDF